ncbi:MAG: hypothetical protein CO164_11950 [Rhodocyclales bacterium CG_4_9_14_3_um_filter_68_10]|nr:MAG: hypothetical protein CO164_11950 [Rhodocyclales bacterium CG_4_9_14_3_um_filter_68_10]
MQSVAWSLSLFLMALITAAFVIVCRGAAGERELRTPYRGRAVVFALTLIAGVLITLTTLSPWPLPAYAANPAPAAKVIDAVGHQWRWDLSESTVPVGKPVEFRVTSADVNHGFSVYRGKTRIIGQTQAMPGFVNRLRLTFDEPGQYEILCLEYCGLAHHGMLATITAVAE